MGGRHRLEKCPEKGSFNMEQDAKQWRSMNILKPHFGLVKIGAVNHTRVAVELTLRFLYLCSCGSLKVDTIEYHFALRSGLFLI